MATRKPARAHIRARVSFNGMVAGDEAEVEVSERVQGWLNAGLVEEVGGGTHPTGPGGPESDAD